MPACPDSNNPQGLKCPTDYGRFAQIGSIDKWKNTHNRNETISITVGATTLNLLERTRTSNYEVAADDKSKSISCQMASGSGNFYQHTISTTSIEAKRELKDDVVAVDRFIQYMDLRNDFVLFREQREAVDKSETDKGSVLWNQYGVTVWLTKFVPDDTYIVERQANGDLLLASKNGSLVIESEHAYGLPVAFGAPQMNEPEQYWLWNISSAEKVGGYDLYQPVWLQGLGERSDYDDADRAFRWNFVKPDGPSSGSGSYSIGISVADPDPTKCSAAHDRLGRYMVSMTDVTGAHRAIITDTLPEDDNDASLAEAQTAELLGGTKLAYPIGIA